jgi:hypothetical protein
MGKDLKSYSMQSSIGSHQLIRKLQTANCKFFISFVLGTACLIAVPAQAGPYLDSAHGNSGYGVNRSSIDDKFTAYATGNCAHCHEMHASVEGAEPEPVNGAAAARTLFAESFNAARTENLYLETDDFCFYCHSGISGQQVRNQDYSTTFGGASIGTGPQSILDAFNQTSYHNLYDIWNFLGNDETYSAWFAKLGNPCSACHNSHLAKRNWDSGELGFPLLSAISMPGVSDKLWGEAEFMSAYFSYEAPFVLVDSREPAGFGEQDGSKTPDYVSFCTSCHNPDKTIWSTTLNRELSKINFGDIGLRQDKHGALIRNGTDFFREPYATAAALKNNFILSCLDCHEPHGSENIMLLRRRINGESLEGTVTTTDSMSYACKRCHTDDLAAGGGTGQSDRWQYVHHVAVDAPYSQAAVCTDCHSTADGSTPVACGNCHGHGMDDSWAGANMSGRTTF